MDKLKTIDVGGFPLTLDDFRQFLGRLTGPGNHGIYQAFNNLLRGFGDDFIIQGCIASGTVGAKSITEGWIMLGGELMKVDAQGPFNSATNNTFTKVVTFDTRGNKDFQNGSTSDTYEQNRGVISGTGGSLRFDDDRFAELNIVENLDVSSVLTTVRKKTKIVEIGDWNMDTLSTVSIAHGLTLDDIKIATVAIIEDNGNIHAMVSEGLTSVIINSTNVVLIRTGSGAFDDVEFSGTSFNRGFIYVEYEA